MHSNVVKIIVALVLIALVITFFAMGFHHELTLEGIKSRQQEFHNYYQQNPALTLGLYGLAYVAVTALSLPGAAILTLAAGAMFGFLPALFMASFASSIGATCAFLTSRFVLRDWVQKKFGKKLSTINKGIKDEGAFYLFSLRLTPFIPFWLVNLLLGLTKINTLIFYGISQLGMLPGTAIYVWAGTKLGSIESLSDIFSPSLIAAFIALGLFPLAAKKGVSLWQKKKA